MPSEKLKPCPWCGKEPEVKKWPTDGTVSVGCKGIGDDACELGPSTYFYKDKRTAIKRWNTRRARNMLREAKP